MKNRTLLFVLALPFFVAAQTPEYDMKAVEEGPREPVLPPALTDGPEIFRKGAFEGWRKGDSILVEPKFSKIEPFYSSKMVARMGGASGVYGLIDERGHEILPFEFNKIEKFRFSTERVDLKKPPKWIWLRATKNQKMGLLDSLGQVIVPFEFERATWSGSDTVLVFWNRGRQVFVSPSCQKPFLETHFDSLSELSLPVRGFFSPVLADGKKALASLKTGKIEFENVEILSPSMRADFLKTRPDLPKNIEWVCRGRRIDGREVLIQPSGEIFEISH